MLIICIRDTLSLGAFHTLCHHPGLQLKTTATCSGANCLMFPEGCPRKARQFLIWSRIAIWTSTCAARIGLSPGQARSGRQRWHTRCPGSSRACMPMRIHRHSSGLACEQRTSKDRVCMQVSQEAPSIHPQRPTTPVPAPLLCFSSPRQPDVHHWLQVSREFMGSHMEPGMPAGRRKQTALRPGAAPCRWGSLGTHGCCCWGLARPASPALRPAAACIGLRLESCFVKGRGGDRACVAAAAGAWLAHPALPCARQLHDGLDFLNCEELWESSGTRGCCSWGLALPVSPALRPTAG